MSKTKTTEHLVVAKISNVFLDAEGKFKPSGTRRIVKTHHVEVKMPEHRFPKHLEYLIPVHNRNTPLFEYHKAQKRINGDIKILKHDIWIARLLKIQAYIAYRLTK